MTAWGAMAAPGGSRMKKLVRTASELVDVSKITRIVFNEPRKTVTVHFGAGDHSTYSQADGQKIEAAMADDLGHDPS